MDATQVVPAPAEGSFPEKSRTAFTASPERFDLNRAELQGKVIKIWSRDDGHVYARVILDRPKHADGSGNGKEKKTPPIGVTVVLKNGLIEGRDESLMNGDHFRISGWVDDVPYPETFREFLAKAVDGEKRTEREQKADQMLAETPQLAAIAQVQKDRNNSISCVVPEEVALVAPEDGLEDEDINTVKIEGTVARVWGYNSGKDRFARLAVYDRHTDIIAEGKGNNGRPLRKAHFVTVMFPDGQVDGRPINFGGKSAPLKAGLLRPGDRIRVVGKFGFRTYRTTVREFLLDVHQVGVLAEVPDSDILAALTARTPNTVIEALKMIQYT